ncbi:MAG TPA: hypothetical protein VNZ06_14285 [Steroidobacteraceae bacterium]|nr:hypothetical protein [Steroidobacteraceae bacterium]
MRFRGGALTIGFGWLALMAAAEAADKPDPALLEFLGSVDSEDKDWHDYLAHTDIEQVAKRAVAARGNPAPASSPAPVTASSPPKTPPVSPTPPANPAPVNQP